MQGGGSRVSGDYARCVRERVRAGSAQGHAMRAEGRSGMSVQARQAEGGEWGERSNREASQLKGRERKILLQVTG